MEEPQAIANANLEGSDAVIHVLAATTSVAHWRALVEQALFVVSAVDSNGRTIWIADAHHNGTRFMLRAGVKG